MQLPLILDIAIGLVFIYLLLSLLASEIQELIATILQWRAEHLKKSIELLFTGNSKEIPANRRFTNEFYRYPLIRSLNHQAKGHLSTLVRQILQPVINLYYAVTRTQNVFAEQQTGPSYIPSETFATALVQQLSLEDLGHKYSELILRNSNQEKLVLIENVLSALRNSLGESALLDYEYQQIKRVLNELTKDFAQNRLSFSAAFQTATDQLLRFVDNTEQQLQNHDPCKAIVRQRLPYLRQSMLLRQPEPSIAEVVSLLTDDEHYDRLPPELLEIILRSLAANHEYYEQLGLSLSEMLTKIREDQTLLPKQLRESLKMLAPIAQANSTDLATGIRELEAEIQLWFDRSMERASGVYKRNARGVALLIGCTLAVAANADTFHIVARLSSDSLVRSTIGQAANQIAVSTFTPGAESAATEAQQLETVKTALEGALDELPVPIGWGETNVQQQAAAGTDWSIPFLRRLLSWLLTGIAISMGASFWYGILNRIVPIRNTGKAPDSSSGSN